MRRILAFLSLALTVPAFAPAVFAADKPVEVRGSAGGGYDNNVRLDSFRKGDRFFQESVSVRSKHTLAGPVRGRLEYDLFNVNYAEVTDLNVLWQDVGAGVDVLLSPSTALQFDYDFEYVYFPRNEPVSSFANKGRAGIVHRVDRRTRLRAGLAVLERQFTDNKLRQADSVLSASDERTDLRFGPDAELALQLTDRVLLRTGYLFYDNDSDDQFHDFYDFNSHTGYASGTFKLTSKAFVYLKGSFENLNYDSRPLVGDPARFEEAWIYTGTATFYYALTQRFSLAATYSYRQKTADEPSREYSGSVSTLGLHCVF